MTSSSISSPTKCVLSVGAKTENDLSDYFGDEWIEAVGFHSSSSRNDIN